MKMMNKVFFSLALVIVFIGCSHKQETSNQIAADSLAVQDSVAGADSIKRIVPLPEKNERLDFTAMFLAGIPQEDSNSFARVEKVRSWKKFKSSMDTAWTRMDQQRLSKIK